MNNKVFKVLSLLLAFLITITAVPVGEFVAFAKKTEEIRILNIYEYEGDDTKYKRTQIFLSSEIRKEGSINIILDGREEVDITNEFENNNSVYNYEGEGPVRGLRINDNEYELDPENYPSISGRSPGYNVESTQKLELTLSNVTEEIKLETNPSTGVRIDWNDEGEKKQKAELSFDNNMSSQKYGVMLTEKKTFNENNKNNEKKLTFINRYDNAFFVRGKLNVSDDIRMTPNTGSPDSEVTISGSRLNDGNISVFFVPIKESNRFLREYRAEKGAYDSTSDPNKLTVKVPKGLTPGEHEVYLTNDVNSKGGVDLESEVHSVSTPNNDRFVVINARSLGEIIDVTPDKGPDSPRQIEIYGKNLGWISEDVFIREGEITPDIKRSENELIVEYSGDGKKSIGQYTPIKDSKKDSKNDSIKVKNIKRKIKVIIGNQGSFKGKEDSEKHQISSSNDRIFVWTPGMNLEDFTEKHDVVVEITTEITSIDGEEYEIIDKIKWNNKYTYEKSNLKPEIKSIMPKNIPITMSGETGTIEKDIKLYIDGENFIIHNFEKNGENHLKRPIIKISDNFILDPNIDENNIDESNNRIKTDMKIYDSENNILDGGSDRKIGTKMVVTIPKGTKVPSPGDNKEINITNPIINDDIINKNKDPEGITSDSELINFVTLLSDSYPKITSITPDKVSTTGYRNAEIVGSGFKPGVKVYIDGEEIRNVDRSKTGTNNINLDLPPMDKQGKYEIMVQNRDGGLDITDVYYVDSEINIKINDFAPKEGGQGTKVMATGQGFVRASNNRITELTELGLDRLIGTKVLLGDQDINEYGYKTEGGKIELPKYKLTDNLFEIKDNDIVPSKDYDSILLKEDNKDSAYYSVFFDMRTREYKITDGSSDEIVVNRRNINEIKTETEDDKTVIKYNDRKWNVLTPYKVEDGEITGHRVRIKNSNELEFEVPEKQREGLYDVKVRNYDAMEDSKTGNNGFYYFFQPQSDPKIERVRPNAGTVQGGYFIDIEGSDFIDNGFDSNNNPIKTSVTIGTVQVDPEDVNISSDGTRITVRVPEYPGNLTEEIEADRKDVNVTVVNHDGGSFTLADGFSYRIPISNPQLYRIVKDRGSAAGGEEVVIEGADFRFFEPYLKGESEEEQRASLFSSLFKNIGGNPEAADDTSDESDENGEVEEDEEDEEEDSNEEIEKEMPEGFISYEDLNNNKVWDDIRKDSSANAKVKINGKEKTFSKKGDLTDEEWERYVYPILPKIYFGSKEATITNWTGNSITVETPRNEKGPVDVYLVNNDYGTSNKLRYTYEASNPVIDSITPPNGHKQGNESVEILGSGFQEGEVRVYDKEGKVNNKNLVKVQFGLPKTGIDENMTNRSLEMNDKGSGRISNQAAEAIAGNLNVKFNGVNKTISVYLGEKRIDGTIDIESDETYSIEDIEFNENEEVFLPLNILKNADNESYKGEELIRLSVELEEGSSSVKRLYIDRGFAPEATAINAGQVMLRTPEYYTVGTKDLELSNPDGAKSKAEFEYINPDSAPSITEIKRDGKEAIEMEDESGVSKIVRVSHTGGSIMEIIGEDFRRPVDIYIGGQRIENMEGVQGNVEYEYLEAGESISNRIKFRMPSVSEDYVDMKPLRVVVRNKDKGFATSEPYFIKFTKPQSGEVTLTSVVPDSGPTEGGTVVTINGDNFREKVEGFEGEELEIYFERGNDIKRVPKSDILSVQYDKIVLKTPPFGPGPVNIRVVNPDGSNARLIEAFTYVSSPSINNVVDPDNENVQIKVISLEGGEKIKLKGSEFMEDARVIFNPQLVEMPDETPLGNGVIVIKGKKYRLGEGHYEGTDVEVIDGQNIIVTTPEGNLGDKGVLVINPDNSASQEYELTYGIPEIGAPMDVDAEVMYDQFIRVSWQGVRDALEYEIYASVDGGGFEFVGTTKWTNYIYEDIEPSTDYKFLVRAIGEYGTSKPIEESESPTVRTGYRAVPDDSDGALGENTVINKHGVNGEVIIGDRDFNSSGVVLDLTSGDLAGVKDLTIRIPGSVITDYSSGDITVKGMDYHLKFNPSVFRNRRIEDNRRDSGVVFNVGPYSGPLGRSTRNILASEKYYLKGSTYVNNSETPVDQLRGSMLFNIHKNNMVIQSRRLNGAGLSVYDESRKDWVKSQGVQRMGLYGITGRRR